VIRIVLADDHTLVREGIRSLLELVEDFTLAGEASDGAEAVRIVCETKPDVLLLDMRMPKGDGRFVVSELRRLGALPATLVLTTFEDDEAALEVVQAGVRGFLLKDVSYERLVHAVRAVAAGETMIHPALTARAERALSGPRATGTAREGPELSPREREVLRLVAAGYSNREIAKALFVAEGTVKNHVSNILTKMEARDRTRAVLKAAERGYL
jgi:DNA-binding NarL/FixJ family response regulator